MTCLHLYSAVTIPIGIFGICICDRYTATGPLEKLETFVRAMIEEIPSEIGLQRKVHRCDFFLSKFSTTAFTECNAALSKVTFLMKKQHRQKETLYKFDFFALTDTWVLELYD